MLPEVPLLGKKANHKHRSHFIKGKLFGWVKKLEFIRLCTFWLWSPHSASMQPKLQLQPIAVKLSTSLPTDQPRPLSKSDLRKRRTSSSFGPTTPNPALLSPVRYELKYEFGQKSRVRRKIAQAIGSSHSLKPQIKLNVKR